MSPINFDKNNKKIHERSLTCPPKNTELLIYLYTKNKSNKKKSKANSKKKSIMKAWHGKECSKHFFVSDVYRTYHQTCLFLCVMKCQDLNHITLFSYDLLFLLLAMLSRYVNILET